MKTSVPGEAPSREDIPTLLFFVLLLAGSLMRGPREPLLGKSISNLLPMLWACAILLVQYRGLAAASRTARRTKAYLYIALAACAINVALNLLWIPRWQASGAAWATIVSEASVTIGGVLALRRNPFGGSPGKPRP